MHALCLGARNVANQYAAWCRFVNIGSCTTRVFVTACAFIFAITQKTMQNFEVRNIKDKRVGHVPYIYNNLSTNQVSHRIRNVPCDYTYTRSSGKQGVRLDIF